MGGVAGEVIELVGVVAVVVEFLGSVLVENQPPIPTPDGMVAEIGRCDGGALPRRGRFVQLRHEGKPLQVGVPRQLAQFDQRRVDVEQAGGFRAGLAGTDAWSGQ